MNLEWTPIDVEVNTKECYAKLYYRDTTLVMFVLKQYQMGIRFYKAYLTSSQDEISMECKEHRLDVNVAKQDAVELIENYVMKSQISSKDSGR